MKSRAITPGTVRRIVARIEGIGGIADAQEMEFRSGTTNRVGGVNATGKTTAAQAIAYTLGDDTVSPELREGADIGVVEVAEIGTDGEPIGKASAVVPSKGRARRKGEPTVETSERAVRALDLLLTGDHAKTPETRNKNRVQAFLSIVRPEVDAAAAKILCEGDAGYSAWLLELAASGQVKDLLAGADALQKRLQREARESEAAAESWAGRAAGAAERVASIERTGLPAVEHPDVPGAQAKAEAARVALAEIRRDAAARREKEELQAQIRASSTERPDPSAAEAEVRRYLEARNAARGEAAELSEEIARLQERHRAAVAREAEAANQGRAAEARWNVTKAAAEVWDRQQAILAETITGPGPDEVAAAEMAVESAACLVEAHRLAVERAAAVAEEESARVQAERAALRAKELRAWNAAVPARVADVLARSGGSGFTIADGMLAFRSGPGEPRDFDSRLSPGEKVKAAFPLVAQALGGWVMLSGEIYRAWLDDAGRIAVEEWAAAHPESFVVTEEPTSGGLHVSYGPFVQGGA